MSVDVESPTEHAIIGSADRAVGGVKQSSLLKDVLLTFAQQWAALLIGILTSVVLARALGAEQLGIYRVAVLIPILIARLFDGGFSTANVYFVGSGTVSLRQACRFSMLYVAVVTAIAVPFVAMLVVYNGAWLLPHVPGHYIIIALLAFPCLLLTPMIRSLLQATRNFVAYNQSALCDSAMLFILILFMSFAFGINTLTTLVCMVIAQVCGLVITIAWLRGSSEPVGQGPSIAAYGRQAFSYGWKLHLSQFANFLSYRADILLLAVLVGPAIAGVYSVAVALLERIGMLSQAVQTAVLPRIAGAANAETLRGFTPKVCRCVLAATLVLALLVCIVGLPIVWLLYGQEYAEAYPIMLAMSPGIVALSASRTLASDLVGRGLTTATCVASISALIVNVVLNLCLIPRFGGIGAAVATSVSYSLMAAMIWISYLKASQVPWWSPLIPRLDELFSLIRVKSQGNVRLP